MPITSLVHSSGRQTRAQQFLQHCGEHFDAALNMRKLRWKGNGYHSHYPEGEWACPIRENLDYALTLFDEGSPASRCRAEAIVREVLALQDLDTVSPTYGIWPWLREESLAQMAPPDWNWADFCGVRLSHILGLYGDRVTPHLTDAIKVALNAAAYSIFRRNVGPGYTNIAIKGALVCAQAGRLLNIPLLTGYAQQRLERFVAFTRQYGGFQEYNSPTYGMLVVLEIERGLMLINDPILRDLLLEVHRIYWEQTAQSLHLGLGQLCGPHSRAYSDLLDPVTSHLISERLGIDLPVCSGETNEKLGTDFLLTPIPCPPDIRQQILSAPADSFVRCNYIHADSPSRRRESSIWKSANACLGSVNYDNLWTQRRPLLAYWRTGESIAVLRVRLMHDGQDFASGLIRTTQEQNELLGLVTLVTNKGDFHDHLDIPSSGAFEIANFELKIELTAPDAQVRQLKNDNWLLQSGSIRAQVQPTFASISGHTVQWKSWTQDGKVGLCAQIDEGQALTLRPSDLSEAAFGFYLHLGEGAPRPVKLTAQRQGSEVCVTAESERQTLSLSAPLRPEPYEEPC